MFSHKAYDAGNGHLTPAGGAGDSRRGSASSQVSNASSTGARRVSIPVPVGSEEKPLNVTDALVGLIAAAAQAQSDIEELNAAPAARTTCLSNLYREIKSFKLTMLLTHRVLGRYTTAPRNPMPRQDRARHVDLDTLIVALSAAILTVSETENRIEEIVRQAADLDVSTEEMCHRFSRSLTKDANRISMVEFTFSKLISVLQMYVLLAQLY